MMTSENLSVRLRDMLLLNADNHPNRPSNSSNLNEATNDPCNSSSRTPLIEIVRDDADDAGGCISLADKKKKEDRAACRCSS